MARVNLVLGAKGGIGKSFIAALMAQYMIDNFIDKSVTCIDLDFKTQTFSKYRGLDVDLVDIETDGEIDRTKFDVLVTRIAESQPDDVFVVDTGGNIYLSLMNYIKTNDVANFIMDMGHELLLHIPIMGGQELGETMETLREVVHEMPPAAMVVVWVNPFNGVVEKDGKTFEQSDTHLDAKDRIRTMVYIPKWRSDMGRDVSEMLKARVTFEVADKMPGFHIMERQRLRIAKRYLYGAVESSGACL